MLKINKIILSTLILLSVFLFLAIIIINVDAKEIDIYKPIITDDPSLSAMVFATDDTITMDVELIDGRLHVSDSVHSVKNLRVLESMLVNRLKGYNGKEVMLYHVNDAGVKDSSRLVSIRSDGTWTYFYDVEFSEVIIDGFIGTYEVTAYNLSVSDSLNFGQEFNASNVTSLIVNVTDDATKSHPYDINYTGLVGWWKLDDDYTDSSGNGNNGTAYGDTHFVNEGTKYNNGSSFDGEYDHVRNTIFSTNPTQTISLNIVINSWANWKSVFGFGNDSHGMQLELWSDGTLHFYGLNDSVVQFSVSTGEIIVGDSNNVLIEYNESLQVMNLYLNNVLVNSDNSFVIPDTQFLTMGGIMYGLRSSNITTDNFIVYNRMLNESERNNLYYDHLQQLQIKTNSNSTWSSEWNSTADNPIQVSYGAGELITLLNFTVPDTIVQNGITIYDYPSTVQFDAIATVGYTEDITKITETAAAGTYTLNITHAANNTGEGYINYTTANGVLLDADFWNAAVLTTDNPNASLSTTLPNFSISTGYVAATTEYYYLVEQDYFYPPTNIQTTPFQCCVNITWDTAPNANNYSIYELEDGFPYVNIDPVIDGIKDTIYNYAHEFLIFSPNPITHGDYETIYPLRTALGAYLLIESIDNDDKSGDDDTIYYFDLDNNGLTINDPAWKITDNIVKKYLWNGNSWQVTGSTNTVGDSTSGGTHYPIHELFIPVAELGSNWINGSTIKVLVKREDSSLHPDVITWYPYGNINNTDTDLWQEMVLNDPESYIFLNNTTNLWYNTTGLTPFTIYHGAVTVWNGTQETNYGLFDAITEDIPYFNVSGYILDVDNNSLSNAIIYSCNGFVHEITTTNESGYYIGYNFREGNYTICANKSGYIPNSIDIYVSSNMTNQNITLSYVTNADLFNKILKLESQNDEILLNMFVNNTIVNDKIDTILIFILLNMAVIVGIIIGKRGKDNDK